MFNYRPAVVAAFVVSNLAIVASAAAAAPALHEETGRGQRPGPPRPPPPAAFDACQSKAAGDACTVSFHDKTHAGTCITPPPDAGDTRLFCKPNDLPPRPPR
jgi:hypothetical protein